MMITTIFMIMTIIIVVYETSGFMNSISKTIYEWTHPNKKWMYQPLMKPFGCSYCMCFHSIWIYLLFFNGISLIVAFGSASLLTFVFIFYKKMLLKLNNYLNNIK